MSAKDDNMFSDDNEKYVRGTTCLLAGLFSWVLYTRYKTGSPITLITNDEMKQTMRLGVPLAIAVGVGAWTLIGRLDRKMMKKRNRK